MELIIGDYLITSDSRQLILKSKEATINETTDKKTGEVKKTEVRKVYGYFSDLPMLLKNIGRQILYDNDDLETIINKLEEVNQSIKDLNNTFSKILKSGD